MASVLVSPGGPALLDVGPAPLVDAHLGDGDAVEREVDLSVAGPGEPVTAAVAGPYRDRCRAVVAGEGGGRAEAVDARDLADELGGGERAAAGQGEQGRREVGDEAGDLALEGVDGRPSARGPGPTRSLAMRARPCPAMPARRSARPSTTPVRSSDRGRAAPRCPGRGGASGGAGWAASARPRGRPGGRRAGAARARARRAARPAGPARGAPPGRPRARRWGRSCRARAPSGGRRP